MDRRKLFGSHLYSQIVLPLLAASLAVAVIATAVAVYFLRDLTDQWVSQVAEATTTSISDRLGQYAGGMTRDVRIAAENRSISHAESGDATSSAELSLVRESASLGFDNIMLVDTDGVVIESSGWGDVRAGDTPLGALDSAVSSGTAWGRAVFLPIAGKPTLSAIQPVRVSGRPTTLLVVSRQLDGGLMRELAGGMGSAFCFYDADLNDVACTVSPSLSRTQARGLDRALDGSATPEVAEVLTEASQGKVGTASLRIGTARYQLYGRKVELPGKQGPQSYGYVLGAVSQSVSDEAARTTMNLIIMWSVVAVVALVGLGGWVARRVSDPLVELADGARRIADGDFSTKVHVAGSNEIAVLADTFNDMTDSLRDRSESLTKKVLELATLYEMSRALGSTLDMDELLGSVLDSALRIFDLDLGYVALRDKETSTLVIRAIRGGIATDSTDAVRSSMSEWVVREGRPLIFNPDPSAGEGQIDGVTGAKAALCVPLVSSEGTIGSITVGSADPEYRFNGDDVRLLSTIGNHVTIAIGNIELFTSLQEAYLATVRSLAAAVDAKDTYTRGHSDRVAGYATMIAESMGLSHEQRIALEMAAYLHDIGKIGVAEEILLKPGMLTDDEMAQMRHHPLIGANILKPVAFPWAITPVVRHHHEHYDGTGYPAGLRGEEIPLLARILTAADSYEAMTADRPYRAGRSVTEAVEELRRCAGTQFDPRVVEVLAAIVEELERTGDGVIGESFDEVAPEEARAIFAALVDGVLASFRKLGGPRLSNNVEADLDAYFREAELPYRVLRGRLSFTEDARDTLEAEIEPMREALDELDRIMGAVSGSALVDHFYADAFEGFSARMRHLAHVIGLHAGD